MSYRLLIILFVCQLLLGSQPALGQSLLNRLPRNTRLLLRVEDGKRWAKDFESTAIRQVIQSPAFAPLREYLGIASDNERALRQVGLRAKDIRDLSMGEVILARVDPDSATTEADGRGTVTAFIVDEATARKVMEEVRAELSRLGAKEASKPVAKGFSTRFSFPGTIDAWTYSYKSGVFSVADRDWINDALEQPTNAFSDRDDFRRIMERTAAQDVDAIEVQWYVAPWALVTPSKATKRLASQGFDAISAVGGRLHFSGDQTAHRSFIVANKPLEKAASGLSFTPDEVPEVPHWLMAHTTSCLATRLNFRTAMKGYGYWFDESYGAGDEGLFDIVLDDIRDEPGSPGVDIRKDLVEQFRGPLLSLVIPVEKPTDSEVRIFAVGVNNESVVRKAVDGLLAGDPDVTKIKIGNFPAWQFGDLSRGGTRQVLGPNLSGLTISIARGYVVSSPQESALRKVIVGGVGSQPPTMHLQTAAKQLGIDHPIGVGYSENLGPVGRLYERVAGLAARQDAESVAIPELLKIFHLEVNEAKMKELRSKMPKVAELAKQFGESFDAAQDADDGWLLTGVVKKATDR